MSSVAQHRGVVTVLSERSSRRRYGCRGAASASQGRFIGLGYNSCLTIRSSRTRFVTRLKCVVVPLPQLTDSQVAGRLNSGVRPHKASAKVWRHRRCCCSTASVGFLFVALARSSRVVEFSCSCAAPALREFRSRGITAPSFFLLRVRRGAGTVLGVLQAQAVKLHFRRHSCALTIHSSRTRFVAWLKCVVVPLPQLTDQHVAGRLNSSVRPL